MGYQGIDCDQINHEILKKDKFPGLFNEETFEYESVDILIKNDYSKYWKLEGLADELLLTTMHDAVDADTFLDIKQIKEKYEISHILDSVKENGKVVGEIVKLQRR